MRREALFSPRLSSYGILFLENMSEGKHYYGQLMNNSNEARQQQVPAVERGFLAFLDAEHAFCRISARMSNEV